MAISLVGLQLIASLYKHGVLSNRRSVIEIGAQDLFPKQDDVANLLSRLVGLQRDPDILITSEYLYNSLGFTVYKCIDADGRHNALRFDLNACLVREYNFSETFDVVTNLGTTEHVFDQCRVFNNIHDLCGHNGIMIHEVPFQKYLNHGFYNYQPDFFFDLASTNHYEVVGIYLGLPNDIMPYSDETASALFLTNLDIELLVVLRKTSEEPFRNPYRGKYLSASLHKDRARAQYARIGIYEQFFPGVRHPRADSAADINLMTTKRIAKALLRRMADRFIGV